MNEITIEEFHENLQQEIISDSHSREIKRQISFFENVNEELIENGEITPNYDYAFHKVTGVEVNGYGYDEDRQILFLTVNHYSEESEVETLNSSMIETKFKRLKGFLHIVLADKYHDIDDNAVFEMAQEIRNYINAGMVSKIRMFLLSNAKATRNLKVIDNEEIDDLTLEFRVIDLDYLYQQFLLQGSGGDISINTEIPCIEIDTKNDEYFSYLGILNGNQITAMYEDYGQKLFEQNVRTFLQFRGNVNKGIRDTIRNNPERFFAFNNGITATATDVEIENGVIKHLSGLQIVNGGQTTSAIYSCFKKEKLPVDNVTVQMKLSVVKDKEKQSEFVSKVSEYANTQNKINKSDFFSNSRFHVDFKEHSKRVHAPPVDGGQKKTRWYYERVRGEYLNDQAYLTPSKKRQFAQDWPSKQKMDKTFISKSEMSWLRLPHTVAKGAAACFDEFAEVVTKQLDKDQLSITEDYFKQVICRVIMFRAIEKIISRSDWYSGGYRSQTVTYSMAYLSELIKGSKNFFNFEKIWEIQKLPLEVEEILKEITYQVYQSINEPPEGHANVAMWCRKPRCWDKVKEDLTVTLELSDKMFVGKDIVEAVKTEQKKKQKLTDEIQIQAFVVDPRRRKEWASLVAYWKQDLEVSPMKMDILQKFSNGVLQLPSPKQSIYIYELYNSAKDSGWEP